MNPLRRTIARQLQNDALSTRCLSFPCSPARRFSTFVPPPPNAYHGAPVYDPVDLASPPSSSAGSARNADPDAVFVVVGASRGIGLEYVRALLSRTAGHIVACCRDPAGAEELGRVAEAADGRATVLPLDVAEQAQVERLANELRSGRERVDGLFNVAGILGDGDAGPERNVSALDRTFLEKNMTVNVVGPMMVIRELAPLLKARKGKKLLPGRSAPSAVVNMSARVGSLADCNRAGLGWHSYRMSKAALNMGTRVLAHELKRQGTWTVALYPGMTDTDLSKPFQKGVKQEFIFPVEFTVGRMLDVVDRMEEKHSGGLYDWAGQALPF
uniref:Uncharacterized protein n=1 Tax=Corethron hystrix TaxID=216773 RepID=A0A7S1BR16_9STRA